MRYEDHDGMLIVNYGGGLASGDMLATLVLLGTICKQLPDKTSSIVSVCIERVGLGTSIVIRGLRDQLDVVESVFHWMCAQVKLSAQEMEAESWLTRISKAIESDTLLQKAVESLDDRIISTRVCIASAAVTR
jgi:hypothetical protein